MFPNIKLFILKFFLLSLDVKYFLKSFFRSSTSFLFESVLAYSSIILSLNSEPNKLIKFNTVSISIILEELNENEAKKSTKLVLIFLTLLLLLLFLLSISCSTASNIFLMFVSFIRSFTNVYKGLVLLKSLL